jgi:hypothetical protein
MSAAHALSLRLNRSMNILPVAGETDHALEVEFTCEHARERSGFEAAAG